MLILWSIRQIHNHHEVLNAQTVGKEFAFGGEQEKTQWTCILGKDGDHIKDPGTVLGR